MTNYANKSATELVQLIKNKQVGCEQLLDYFLARVATHNTAINAIVVVDENRARARAKEADAALARGEHWGPLHGLPMTCKESFDVGGWPTTRGTTLLNNNVAQTDALAIQRLEKAGAILFGKTNVPEQLIDTQSYNDVYGTTNNPWSLGRTCGGSSGGSAAALAAGMTALEIGSDIGGSIRNPAHYCGVFGHKPTWGLIPPRGHASPGILAQSDLAVVGPLAKSAQDLRLTIDVLAGPDEIASQGLRLQLPELENTSLAELSVAVWKNDTFAPVSSETVKFVEKVSSVFNEAGATVNTDARPELDPAQAHHVFQSLMQSVSCSGLSDDAYAGLQEKVSRLDPDDSSDRAQTLRRQVSTYRDYARMNEQRTHFRWAWHRFFEQFDVLVAPIMATGAFPHDHRRFGERRITVDGIEQPYFQQLFWAGLSVCSYLPSTVIPAGLDNSGLPIGIQIIGPEYGDLKTIRVAEMLEKQGFKFNAPPGYSGSPN